MPGGGNLIKDGIRRTPPSSRKNRSKYHFTRSLVVDFPFVSSSQRPTRCLSAPKIMDSSHSRSASPRERPLHRPPSPPDSPSAFDNQGFQHEDDPNHNESFTSSATPTNGTNGHVKNEVKTLEAVNLELINMTPKKKDVEIDSGTNPYDEYFVPVNEHRKYMRGEKLYVTADKRGDKTGCKRCLCWTLLGLVVVGIVVLIVLAATGLLFSNTPTTLEQYNSSISSARALGGIGITQQHGEFPHDNSEHDHSQYEKPVPDHAQYHPRNHMQGNTQKQDTATESDFPPTSADFGESAPMYVAQTVEGEVKIDNEEFAEVLQDPENDGYKDFTADFTAALRSALFNRNTLKNDSVRINVQVVQIRRGSIIVTYRVHWHAKSDKYEMENFLTPTKLKHLLNSYLDKNNRMISIYHIAEDKITTRSVLDKCQINKNDCEYGCKFDETTLDFICTCPPSFILEMENQKKCVRILENAEEPDHNLKEFTVLAISNNSKTSFSDNESVINLKHTTEINPETTEADIDLFLSHIMSENKKQTELKPDSSAQEPAKGHGALDALNQEPEPTQEPTPEPDQESLPELAMEPVPELTKKPKPEPVQKPYPEPTQEPTPEPAQQSTPELSQEHSLEPTQETSPEPTQEPSPEPPQQPSAKPAEEPFPVPTQEPSSPEPTKEHSPEPSQEPTSEPTSEPTQESTPEPAQETTPKSAQETTPESTQEPSPEPTQEPTPELAQEQKPVKQQSSITVQESTQEPMQSSTSKLTLDMTSQLIQEITTKAVQEPSTVSVLELTPTSAQNSSTESEEEDSDTESSTELTQEQTSEAPEEVTHSSALESLPELPASTNLTSEPQQDTNDTNTESLRYTENDLMSAIMSTLYTTTEIVATSGPKFKNLSELSDEPVSKVMNSTTPVSVTEFIAEQDFQTTSQPMIEPKIQLHPPLTTNLTEIEFQSTSEGPSIKSVMKASEGTSNFSIDTKEHILEIKSKQPKLLKPMTIQSTATKENNDSSFETELQSTTPDSIYELDMEIKKLLNLPPSENDVPQHSEMDYLGNTKAENHSEFKKNEQNDENDEKINNISLDEISKMLTTTTPHTTSTSIEQIETSTVISDKLLFSFDSVDKRKDSLSTTKSTLDTTYTSDTETTTVSEWIHHNHEESKLNANNVKSINGILNEHTINFGTKKWKQYPILSTEATITQMKVNEPNSSITTVSVNEGDDSAKNISDDFNISNLTTLPSLNQDLLTITMNPNSVQSKEDLFNPIHETYKPDFVTDSSIRITIDDQKDHLESTPKPIEITFEPSNEIHNNKMAKLNHFDFITNDKLKKQKVLYKNKLDDSPHYDDGEQTDTTPNTETDWLTEKVTEIKFEDVINAKNRQNKSETESYPQIKVNNDFEHHHQLRANAKPSLNNNEELSYGIIDYNSEDSPTKRENINSGREEKSTINTMRLNDLTSKLNNTKLDNSLKSTTVIEYIYKNTEKPIRDIDWHNLNPLMRADDEPAPVWELHEPEINSSIHLVNSTEEKKILFRGLPQSSTLQSVKIEEITSASVPKYDNDTSSSSSLHIADSSSDLSNVTRLNNLNVTIYEISNQNLPTTKSSISQTIEYEDHESEMNPFLPEIENNKSLVKKLQEGHDIEPINVNETQNENLDDGHASSSHNSHNKSSDVINKDDPNKELKNTTVENQIKTLAETKQPDTLVIPIFLKDTEDLNIKHTTRGVPTIFEATERAEEPTVTYPDLLDIVTEDNDLNVVPLETKSEKKVTELEPKIINSRSIISLIKKADGSNLQLTNLA